MKPLTFKEWLKECYAIDYDRWAPEMTDATHKVWYEGYEWYLKERHLKEWNTNNRHWNDS